MRGNAAVQGGSPLKRDFATNTSAAIILTATGVVGNSHVLFGVQWSYQGGTPSGTLEIKDGTTVIKSINVTGETDGVWDFSRYLLVSGLPISMGADLIVALSSGGAGVTGRLNMDYR